MISRDKNKRETNANTASLARWILALGVVTSSLFLVITFSMMMS